MQNRKNPLLILHAMSRALNKTQTFLSELFKEPCDQSLSRSKEHPALYYLFSIVLSLFGQKLQSILFTRSQIHTDAPSLIIIAICCLYGGLGAGILSSLVWISDAFFHLNPNAALSLNEALISNSSLNFSPSWASISVFRVLICGSYLFLFTTLNFRLHKMGEIAVSNAKLYRQSQKDIRIRDDFLSIASHEIRNPLTSIHLQHQLLLKSARGQLPPATIRPYLTQVHPPTGNQRCASSTLRLLESCEEQTGRLIHLLDEVLDFSKIRAGAIRLNFEFLDLSEVIGRVVSHFKATESKAANLITVHPSGSVTGYWDRLKIEQVVTNLISNAFKYGRNRPIELKIEGGLPGPTALFLVKDQGIGIPDENLDRIFKRYERVATEHKISGLGIGLYVARQMIEAQGGKIRVQSQPQVGSVFTVELPTDRK